MTLRRMALWSGVITWAACLLSAAEWKALGPFGGPAAVVQVDPHASQTLIAGTSNALLFRSRDLGEHWEPLPFPLRLRAVLHTLVIDPRVPSLYLAGISTELPGTSGLLRSTDGGAVWAPVAAFRNLQVRALAVFRGDSQVMAAGTDRGVFLSMDHGNTWERISPADKRELQPVVSLAFDPKDRQTIYAGTPHLPWKTTDSGATWRSIHAGMIDDSDVFSIMVDRNRPLRVFASACSGIYRSYNGGFNWSKLPGAKDASFRTYTIVQDPQYENVLFAGTTHGMIRSSDGGATWERIAPYATHSIAFDLRQLGRIFIATDERGILRTGNNGRTWQQVNNGFCNRHLTPLAPGDRGSLYIGTAYDTSDGGLFRLANGSDHWTRVTADTRVFGEPLLNIAPTPGSRARMYGATPHSVIVSRDAGKTWAHVSSPGPELSNLFVPPWGSGRMLAFAGPTLLVSRDSGKTWKKFRLPNTAAVRSLVELDPPWIAVLTASDIFLTSDGEGWRSCARLPGADVYGLVQLPGRALLAASSAGLRISTDQCGSWRAVGAMFEGNTIQAICRHPVRTGMIFAARYGAVFSSNDAGRSWTRISPPDWAVSSIRQMLVAPGMPDRLFILTQQQGVLMLPLDQGSMQTASMK